MMNRRGCAPRRQPLDGEHHSIQQTGHTPAVAEMCARLRFANSLAGFKHQVLQYAFLRIEAGAVLALMNRVV